MLYERWIEVARRERSEVALMEVSTGRSWTFGELEREADRSPALDGLVSPSGRDAAFVFEVLRAWRHGAVLCPVDAGQTVETLPELPAGCVHLKLTSASTGVSRLVAFTADQLAADVDQIVGTMGLRRDWPNIGVLSLAHSYGFSNLVLPLLLHGVPLILAESNLPEALRQALEIRPEVTLPAVPVLWRHWLEASVISPRIRLAISAGAPLPVALESALYREQGVKVHNFYGATECGGIAYDAEPLPRADDTWVGQPMRGVQLAVATDGCLEVRAASVGQGYLPADPQHLGQGRYHSRDLAEVGATGVRLLGRASDLINVAGRKVGPETIESVAAQLPGVGACVVFGVPEDGSGRNEKIVAIVAPSRSEALNLDIVRDRLLSRLPAWQVPREWKRVEEIAANVRGKVSRAGWRQRYLSGDLG